MTKRKRFLLFGGALLLVLILTAGGFLWLRPDAAQQPFMEGIIVDHISGGGIRIWSEDTPEQHEIVTVHFDDAYAPEDRELQLYDRVRFQSDGTILEIYPSYMMAQSKMQVLSATGEEIAHARKVYEQSHLYRVHSIYGNGESG